MQKRRVGWVFLDRDGIINRKAPAGDYVKRPKEVVLLPGAAAAIRRLNDVGIWVGIVTNQRGIALGRMTESEYADVQETLFRLLALEGAHVDAVYHCPHHADTCDCRKPAPGMLLQAQRDHGEIDFSRAAIVGDSASDVEAGRRVGMMTVMLVSRSAPVAGRHTDLVSTSLEEAVDWLISDLDK